MPLSSPAAKDGAGSAVPLEQQARMLGTLLSNLPGMVYRCRNDADWTMLFVSDGCHALTGYAPADLVGSRRVSYAELIVPADRALVWEAVQAALAKREPFELRYRILTAVGAEKWVWERGLGLFDAGGRLDHLEGFITDITAAVCAERHLRESEHRLALVFNATRDMMCLVKVEPGPAFRIVSINEEYVRTIQRAGFALTAAELAGRTFDEWKGLFRFSDEAWRALVDRYDRVVATRAPLHHEERTVTPTGIFYGDTWLTPVCNQQTGAVEFVLFTSKDVTDEKRAEEALRASEEKFSKAFRASPDAISVSDALTGRILDVNEGFLRVSGYTREEVIGRTSAELALWSAPDGRARMMTELEARGFVRDWPVTARVRGGDERHFLLSAERVEIAGCLCLVILSRDITEQKRAEQALRESEEKFAKAFRTAPQSLVISDLATGRYLEVNDGFEKMMGYRREEVLGRTSLEIGVWVDPRDRELLVAHLNRGRSVRDLEVRFVTRSGRVIVTMCSAEIIEVGGRSCMLSMIHDVTAQRRDEQERAALEHQLRQAQKLEALGQLAGGIAHDFNNILTGILAYAELAQLDADRPAEVRKHAAAVKAASQRAGDLVRQILTFSRRQAPERKPVKLSAVVREAIKLLRSTIPRTIEIVEVIDEFEPVVLADATQIHQVLMNLCTNAAHAMQDGPGRLAITLAACDVRADDGAAPRHVAAGRHARLTVADTGHGMDAATLSHIFEPFFTTKEPGQGTGLGLAVVHGIVEEHDGVITVRSAPGAGTTFEVYFPEFHALDLEDTPADAPLPRGSGQRVLFVDDEEAIARAVTELLGRLGYRVTMHTDPRAAWSAFDADPAAFDLVLTDLTMPHWTGLELARRMLARRPDIPIMLSTGHGGAWTPEAVRAIGLRTMIGKPLNAAGLARAIHQTLGSAAR